ncbi:MAG: hypothetical protein Q9N02_00800 [Ghiorsea sp.]|nr:hypothetical protein [Ghiorsea sp.]
MKRLFASIALSLLSLAIFIVISIFSMAAASKLTQNPDAVMIIKPMIFLFAVVLASMPWVFAAHLTAEDGWRQATKLLYFLPVFLATPSFMLPAIAFAIIFVAARMHYMRKEAARPYRVEVSED